MATLRPCSFMWSMRTSLNTKRMSHWKIGKKQNIFTKGIKKVKRFKSLIPEDTGTASTCYEHEDAFSGRRWMKKLLCILHGCKQTVEIRYANSSESGAESVLGEVSHNLGKCTEVEASLSPRQCGTWGAPEDCPYGWTTSCKTVVIHNQFKWIKSIFFLNYHTEEDGPGCSLASTLFSVPDKVETTTESATTSSALVRFDA